MQKPLGNNTYPKMLIINNIFNLKIAKLTNYGNIFCIHIILEKIGSVIKFKKYQTEIQEISKRQIIEKHHIHIDANILF